MRMYWQGSVLTWRPVIANRTLAFVAVRMNSVDAGSKNEDIGTISASAFAHRIILFLTLEGHSTAKSSSHYL
jgi:hypothetical protein